MQQQQQPSLFQSLRNANNTVHAITQFIYLIGEVFVRLPGTFGKRHCGFHMGVSWLVMFFWSPLFFPREDPRPMACLWLAATGLLFVHRIVGVWDRWRGYRVNSLYNGRSWFPGPEVFAKAVLEPAAFVVAGVCAAGFSQPMSVYLILVGICASANAICSHQAYEAQIQAALDAQADAQLMQYEMQRRGYR